MSSTSDTPRLSGDPGDPCGLISLRDRLCREASFRLVPTRFAASLEDKKRICSLLRPHFGIEDSSKLARTAVWGMGEEMSSEWLEAHGEGYSGPVDAEVVEKRDMVGWSSIEELDPAL